MKKDKTILILFIISLVLYALPVGLKQGLLAIPDEAASISTAQNLIAKGSFYIQNINYVYNEKYNTNVFGQKLWNYFPQKGMVQQYPFGLALLLAIFGKLSGGRMEYMVAFIGALGVVIFYLLNKLYFNKEQALYASLLLLVMPGYFYWSTFTMPDVPSAVLFILGFYLLEVSLRSRRTIWFISWGIIFGLIICLKYANCVLFPALVFYLYIRRRELVNLKMRLLIGCLAFLTPILLLMLYHYHIYGNPFLTGYHTSGLKIAAMLETEAARQGGLLSSIFSVIPFHPRSLTKHLLGFPLQAAVALPYVLFGIIATFYLYKRNRQLFLLILSILSLTVLFNANVSGTFGRSFAEMTMHSSYLRYLLLGFVLLIIPVACFISDFPGSKLIKVNMLAILLLASIFNNLSSVPEHNLRSNYQRLYPQALDERKELLRNIPQQGVIFTEYASKYLLPERATARPRYLTLEKMLNITALLLKDNIQVYYKDDGKDQEKTESFLRLTNNELINEQIKLYQIISINLQ